MILLSPRVTCEKVDGLLEEGTIYTQSRGQMRDGPDSNRAGPEPSQPKFVNYSPQSRYSCVACVSGGADLALS